jgi:hypothetical protein
LAWLEQEGFDELIAAEWAAGPIGKSPIQTWQNKIRHLRRFLRGWARNLSGKYKKEKERLLSIIDLLDIKAEMIPLSQGERNELKIANEKLNKLRRDEEIKWAQRAKVKYIQEGGDNTKYFHLIANGKHRKKKIYQLEQEEGTIVGDDNLRVYISEYYKKLFGNPEPSSVVLDESIIDDIPQLLAEENRVLIENFSMEEFHDAIFQMENNKSPRPDGFPAEFYQHFWGVIKFDLMALFESFQKGELPLYKLNFGVITLLPKKENATQIQQYRPICLLNVSFKIFTKVATNRISEVAQKVIKPTQTTFIPGRHILKGVVVLHETIHEMHRRKLDGVIFKIDFKKAYDKVNGPFCNKFSVRRDLIRFGVIG